MGCCEDWCLGELRLGLYREKGDFDITDFVDSTLLHTSV